MAFARRDILAGMPGLTKRLSAGVVVLRETDSGPKFLMLRAFRHWDFPKGMVERGETPLEAACREVEEETTIRNLDFAWGEEYRETGPYSRGKTARYYIARTGQAEIMLPVVPELGRAEHAEYRWVDHEAAMALASPRLKPVVRWACGVAGI